MEALFCIVANIGHISCSVSHCSNARPLLDNRAAMICEQSYTPDYKPHLRWFYTINQSLIEVLA